MGGKFNTELLKNPARSDTLDRFKNTKAMFERADNTVDKLPVDRLLAFSRHPFQLNEERVSELAESIREQGVLVPLLVRALTEPQRGYYEILAGHHRGKGAQLAGLPEVPCIILNVDDATAALIVVESNRQRGFSDMLPSEIARALKLEHDALKCQGKRTDLTQNVEAIMALNADENWIDSTSCTVCTRIDTGDKVAAKNEMSRRSLYLYIRLNELISELLERVDSEEIAVRTAVDLSYLNEQEQMVVNGVLDTSSYKVDMKKAALLKEYSKGKRLNGDTARLILSGAAFDKKEKPLKEIKVPMKRIRGYLPASLPEKEYTDYIIAVLKRYQEEGEDTE